MPSANPRSDLRKALLDVLMPVVTGAGFDLEDLVVSTVGRRSVLRVVVDSDAGVSLDAIAQVSRAISDALDADSTADLIDDAYQLEVTSPGIDRPLTEPRHWRRAIGRLVTVEVGGKALTGRVVSADTAGVMISVDGGPKAAVWSEIGPGRVQVEFNRDGGSANEASMQAEES